MTAKPPTIEQLRKIAGEYSFHFDEDELESYRELIEVVLNDSYQQIDQLAEVEPPPVKYPRSSGYRPGPEENPLNAWYWRCSIKGADSGLLAGKRIAIKDNTCVAGIPMMNGCAAVEGYVPEFDATVVTRILDAGGEIVGKAVCEDLCFSGGSHTSYTGPVLNPHDPTRSAGGSSSGSGAVVAAGDADMATGGDQGGSIRVPSAWCGIYGLKPTQGLIPYTGIFPIELTLDHTGPMTTTVEDAALFLEATAGEDGLDPRQPRGVQGRRYSEALTGNAEGIRIGMLAEGFGWPGLSEEDVDETVRNAVGIFGDLGAEILTEDISIPLHRSCLDLWAVIGGEGAAMLMHQGNSQGTNWLGHYNTSLLEVFGRGMKTRADDLSVTNKLAMMYGQYMQNQYRGRYYAKAQNIRLRLRRDFERAFEQVDIIAMPTTPMKPQELPGPDAPPSEIVDKALDNLSNTNTFDLTHHPAITVPCGRSEGLPIGMMLVGRHWDEETVLRAAHAFEQTGTYGDVRVDQHAQEEDRGLVRGLVSEVKERLT
jgi:amidase